MNTDEPPTNHGVGDERDETLQQGEIERYSRQLLLPQFGTESQKLLRKGRILVVGAGGLGCPAALYLAGAGVGTIGLVDRPSDVVEQSNLHRQIAHSEGRVGMNKVQSAKLAITALNSRVDVEEHREIVSANAVELVSKYHIVLDCTDNVMSRYLVSDACAAARVPLVSGSAIGMEGQLTVYCADEDTPCYRCIFPAPPPPSCVGSCDSAGVLGPVPGVIGVLQALEALKVLGNIKKATPLKRKLLLFDAGDTAFRSVKLRPRSDNCLACGKNSELTVSSFDYRSFALGITPNENGKECSEEQSSLGPEFRITANQFSEMRKGTQSYRLIDVRPETQFAMCCLDEAENRPLDKLNAAQLLKDEKLDTEKLVFICRRGNASQQAVEAAIKEGLTNVVDIVGGLQSWHFDVDSSFPLY